MILQKAFPQGYIGAITETLNDKVIRRILKYMSQYLFYLYS
jgi:hypothetical protein